MIVQVCFLLVAVTIGTAGDPAEETTAVHGRAVLEKHEFGDAWVYRPDAVQDNAANTALIIAHGMPGEDETAVEASEVFIKRWTAFADEHKLVLIAPAFDEARYRKAYGGYRGLFGRDIGADAFVERLVEFERTKTEINEQSLLLYGHSAGGQFVCRFVLQHPDRVRAAVLSAPGRYAFPDPNAPWPYGMGRFERTLHWGGSGPNARKREIVKPDPRSFLRAATKPIAVVVGGRDLEPQPRRPAHHGANRIELARQWVREMNALAKSHDEKSRLRGMIVPKIGHNSRQLTPHCQKMFERLVAE